MRELSRTSVAVTVKSNLLILSKSTLSALVTIRVAVPGVKPNVFLYSLSSSVGKPTQNNYTVTEVFIIIEKSSLPSISVTVSIPMTCASITFSEIMNV